MKFTLTIESNNAGMVDDPAIATSDILRHVTDMVGNGFTSGYEHDYNGNLVGYWSLDTNEQEGE